MSDPKKRIFFLIICGIFILGNIGFYVFVTHKKEELHKLNKENLSLRERIQQLNKELEREKQLLSQGGIARINFFQLHNIPPYERTSFFLKKIAQLSSTKGVKVLEIKPLSQEETPYYTKILFALETEATYVQLLKFIEDIEYMLGLNIESLSIIKDEKARIPEVKMVLNSIEMKGKNFARIKLKLVPPHLPRLARDPFSLSTLRAETKRKVLPSKNYIVFYLQGIMRFKDIYKAMINDKIVKKGDRIKGYKVSFIGNDRVVLVKNERYIILRPGTRVMVKKEKEERIPKDIETFLNTWKRAWEEKDLERYIQFYSSQFTHQKMDRLAWENYKKGLFKRYHKIKLKIENIKISRKGNKVFVSFKQYFTTEKYKDIGLKKLILKKENGEWKIVQETWQKISN